MELTFLTTNFLLDFVFTLGKGLLPLLILVGLAQFILVRGWWLEEINFVTPRRVFVWGLVVVIVVAFISSLSLSNAKVKISDEVATKARGVTDTVDKKIRDVAPSAPSFKERADKIIKNFEEGNF